MGENRWGEPLQKRKKKVKENDTAERIPPNYLVLVKGLEDDLDEETFRRDFGECGNIVLFEATQGHRSRRTIIGVNLEAELEALLQWDGQTYRGTQLSVHRIGSGNDEKVQSKFEIFVRGLPSDLQEPDLKKLFAQSGKIVKINMPLRENGRCRGFAWIEFKTEDCMRKALALDGTSLKGARLDVEKAQRRLPELPPAPVVSETMLIMCAMFNTQMQWS